MSDRPQSWKEIADTAIEMNHRLADEIIELKTQLSYEKERNLNNVLGAEQQIADLTRKRASCGLCGHAKASHNENGCCWDDPCPYECKEFSAGILLSDRQPPLDILREQLATANERVRELERSIKQHHVCLLYETDTKCPVCLEEHNP